MAASGAWGLVKQWEEQPPRWQCQALNPSAMESSSLLGPCWPLVDSLLFVVEKGNLLSNHDPPSPHVGTSDYDLPAPSASRPNHQGRKDLDGVDSHGSHQTG